MKFLIVEEIVDLETMAMYRQMIELDQIVNIVSRDDFTNINLKNDETIQFRSPMIEMYFEK